MAIGIICRNCGARLKVAESAAGKLGKCPKCKQAIRVPKAIGPEAHFCDRCEKSLAEEPDVHAITGKMYCGACFEKIQGKKKTGDPILDQLGLNIPGMVVLRGKDQRQMGRMLQDVAAKKDFKKKPDDEVEGEKPPEPVQEPEQEPEAAPEPEEDKAPPEAETSAEAPAEAPPEAETSAEAPPEEEAPAEVPEETKEEEPAEAPAAQAEAPKLTKGQRVADTLLTKLLVDQGVVLEGELELALQYQRGLGKRLIPVLDDLKLTSEDDITRAITENTGLEVCPPGEIKIADHVLDILDDEMLSHYEVIPVEREGGALVAAFPNPLDLNAIKELREALDMKIIPRVCTWSQYTDGRLFLRKARANA